MNSKDFSSKTFESLGVAGMQSTPSFKPGPPTAPQLPASFRGGMGMPGVSSSSSTATLAGDRSNVDRSNLPSNMQTLLLPLPGTRGDPNYNHNGNNGNDSSNNGYQSVNTNRYNNGYQDSDSLALPELLPELREGSHFQSRPMSREHFLSFQPGSFQPTGGGGSFQRPGNSLLTNDTISVEGKIIENHLGACGMRNTSDQNMRNQIQNQPVTPHFAATTPHFASHPSTPHFNRGNLSQGQGNFNHGNEVFNPGNPVYQQQGYPPQNQNQNYDENGNPVASRGTHDRPPFQWTNSAQAPPAQRDMGYHKPSMNADPLRGTIVNGAINGTMNGTTVNLSDSTLQFTNDTTNDITNLDTTSPEYCQNAHGRLINDVSNIQNSGSPRRDEFLRIGLEAGHNRHNDFSHDPQGHGGYHTDGGYNPTSNPFVQNIMHNDSVQFINGEEVKFRDRNVRDQNCPDQIDFCADQIDLFNETAEDPDMGWGPVRGNMTMGSHGTMSFSTLGENDKIGSSMVGNDKIDSSTLEGSKIEGSKVPPDHSSSRVMADHVSSRIADHAFSTAPFTYYPEPMRDKLDGQSVFNDMILTQEDKQRHYNATKYHELLGTDAKEARQRSKEELKQADSIQSDSRDPSFQQNSVQQPSASSAGGASAGANSAVAKKSWPSYSTDDDLRRFHESQDEKGKYQTHLPSVSETNSPRRLMGTKQEASQEAGNLGETNRDPIPGMNETIGDRRTDTIGDRMNDTISSSGGIYTNDRPKSKAFQQEKSLTDPQTGETIKIESPQPTKSAKPKTPDGHNTGDGEWGHYPGITLRQTHVQDPPPPKPESKFGYQDSLRKGSLKRPGSAPHMRLHNSVKELLDYNGGMRHQNGVNLSHGMTDVHRPPNSPMTKDDYHRALDYNGRLNDVASLTREQQSSYLYKKFWKTIERDKKEYRLCGDGLWKRKDVFTVRCSFNFRDYEGISGPNFDKLNAQELKKKKDQPGSVQILFMFYARLYQVLSNIEEKQIYLGGDNLDSSDDGDKFFVPIDLQGHYMGLREIKDFAIDFGLFKITTFYKLTQIYQAIHPNPRLEDKNAKGLTYPEFCRFLCLLAIDVYRFKEPKHEKRILTLISYLFLSDLAKIKSHLYDAFRDHHLQKYDELSDFKKIAKRLHTLACAKQLLPQFPERDIFKTEHGRDILNLVTKKTWVNVDKEWIDFYEKAPEFEKNFKNSTPYIDGGIIEIGECKHFRLRIRNITNHKAGFKIQTSSDIPAFVNCHYVLPRNGIAQGMHFDCFLDVIPDSIAEVLGHVNIECKSHAGEYKELRVPFYLKTVKAKQWFEGDSFDPRFYAHLSTYIPRDDLRVNLFPAGVPPRYQREDPTRLKLTREIKISVNKKLVRREPILPIDGKRPDKKEHSKEKAKLIIQGVPQVRASAAAGNDVPDIQNLKIADRERVAKNFGGRLNQKVNVPEEHMDDYKQQRPSTSQGFQPQCSSSSAANGPVGNATKTGSGITNLEAGRKSQIGGGIPGITPDYGGAPRKSIVEAIAPRKSLATMNPLSAGIVICGQVQAGRSLTGAGGVKSGSGGYSHSRPAGCGTQDTVTPGNKGSWTESADRTIAVSGESKKGKKSYWRGFTVDDPNALSDEDVDISALDDGRSTADPTTRADQTKRTKDPKRILSRNSTNLQGSGVGDRHIRSSMAQRGSVSAKVNVNSNNFGDGVALRRASSAGGGALSRASGYSVEIQTKTSNLPPGELLFNTAFKKPAKVYIETQSSKRNPTTTKRRINSPSACTSRSSRSPDLPTRPKDGPIEVGPVGKKIASVYDAWRTVPLHRLHQAGLNELKKAANAARVETNHERLRQDLYIQERNRKVVDKKTINMYSMRNSSDATTNGEEGGKTYNWYADDKIRHNMLTPSKYGMDPNSATTILKESNLHGANVTQEMTKNAMTRVFSSTSLKGNLRTRFLKQRDRYNKSSSDEDKLIVPHSEEDVQESLRRENKGGSTLLQATFGGQCIQSISYQKGKNTKSKLYYPEMHVDPDLLAGGSMEETPKSGLDRSNSRRGIDGSSSEEKNKRNESEENNKRNVKFRLSNV